MSFKSQLVEELEALVVVGTYFVVWLGCLVLLKKLILAEYQIGFQGLTAALIGALVLSKVVLILEHVSLGDWVEGRPAWLEVVLRTVLYVVGVVVVLLLEKAFEGRHEAGGFIASLRALFDHVDLSHVWVNSICVGGALLSYNVIWAVRRNLGPGGLRQLLVQPLPKENSAGEPR